MNNILLWMLLVCGYILGTFLIGYPIAKASLHVWKHSKKYTFARFFLFPHTELFEDPWRRVGEEDSCNKLCFLKEDVHTALSASTFEFWEKEEVMRAIIAKYIGRTMVVWPIRVCWLLYALCLFTALVCGWLIASLLIFWPGNAVKYFLLKSKKATTIN